MLRRFSALLPALALGAALAGCDSVDEAPFVSQVVVESYQTVDEPLAPVYLSRTVRPDEPALGAAVRDARVTITRLADDGTPEAAMPYRLVDAATGRYEPSWQPWPVRPLTRYRLEAVVPGEAAPVTSETRTPGRFEVVVPGAATVPYAPGPERPSATAFTVTRPVFSGTSRAFVFTSESLVPAPTLDDAVPFVRAILDTDNDGTPDFQEAGAKGTEPTFEDFRTASSPVLSEANYRTEADGTLTIALPWITVVFFGETRVTVSAIDDNLYDFLRSQQVQQGGTGLSPGEVPNLLTRVTNGTGIFGSRSRVGQAITVTPPPAP